MARSRRNLLEEAARATGRNLSRAERIGSRLDRAVELVAPAWALRRQVARVRSHLFRQAFPSGRGQRLHADWNPVGLSGDAAIADLADLRARARDLVRTEPHAASLIRVLEENVVGTGIRPQSRATADETGLPQTLVDEWNRATDRVFAAWANSTLADATGAGTFWELQRLIFRAFKMDGEAIVHPVYLPEDGAPRVVRVAIEVVPAERLGTPTGQAADALPENLAARIRQGVEVGNRDQALAYWIADGNPDDPVRYPDVSWRRIRKYREGRPNVLHLFRREQADQHRGVPVLATVLSTFRMLSKYLEAELTAARVAACISMFVTRSGMADELPPGFELAGDNDGRILERLEPGVIEYLDPGETIQAFKADRPGTTFDPFVTRMLRAIAAAVGLPYELLVRDFSRTNYSSMRAALLETRRGFRCDQALLANLVLQPIRELVLEDAYARGLLPRVPGFLDIRRALFRTRWVPPAWGWVDPTKEIQASRDAVAGGLSTLADEASSNGQDWKDVAEGRARELVALRELEEIHQLPPGSLSGLAPAASDAAVDPEQGSEVQQPETQDEESGPGGSSPDDDTPEDGDDAEDLTDEESTPD